MHCSCISFVCMARHVKWEMIFINRVRTPTNRSTCVCVGRERQIGTETNHVPSLLLCATVLFLLSYLKLIMLFVIIILSIFITMKCKFAAPHGWCWMQASDKFSGLAPICARCAAVLQFCNANRRNEEEMILLINISAGSNIYIYIYAMQAMTGTFPAVRHETRAVGRSLRIAICISSGSDSGRFRIFIFKSHLRCLCERARVAAIMCVVCATRLLMP